MLIVCAFCQDCKSTDQCCSKSEECCSSYCTHKRICGSFDKPENNPCAVVRCANGPCVTVDERQCDGTYKPRAKCVPRS
ncbi:hypothetical protein HCN44_002701 [Aphidius gifuensis]|uniref:Uncharacterized protein n=1 Tax=Aphidius gifuensis TaxID=684658 RepID=A0A835CNS8_APHGI|nr:hypothetical protein HCN44_002701 [Aphidius gifuensis]